MPGTAERRLQPSAKILRQASLRCSAYRLQLVYAVGQNGQPFSVPNEKLVGGMLSQHRGTTIRSRPGTPHPGLRKQRGPSLSGTPRARGGMDGYGWLPYEYVLKGLAVDLVVAFEMRVDRYRRIQAVTSIGPQYLHIKKGRGDLSIFRRTIIVCAAVQCSSRLQQRTLWISMACWMRRLICSRPLFFPIPT